MNTSSFLMRPIAAAVVMGSLLGGACVRPDEDVGALPTTSPTAGPSPTPSGPSFQPLGKFSTAKAMKHVRILAGRIGNRTAGTTGYRRATRYVEGTFRSFGWVTRRSRFDVPGAGPSWSILASWPGRSRGRVILGGHLDTVPGSSGGNDNGTGVATVLELARVFGGTRYARRIHFVAFGAEEQQPAGGHHYGSGAFVDQMADGARDRANAMVSVDMIGKDNPYTIAWMGIGSRATVDLLLDTAAHVGVAASERVTPDWSDNGPFERAGIPAALLWTGDEPNHHSPRDTVENVERPALRNAGRLLVPFILAALR